MRKYAIAVIVTAVVCFLLFRSCNDRRDPLVVSKPLVKREVKKLERRAEEVAKAVEKRRKTVNKRKPVIERLVNSADSAALTGDTATLVVVQSVVIDTLTTQLVDSYELIDELDTLVTVQNEIIVESKKEIKLQKRKKFRMLLVAVLLSALSGYLLLKK